MNKKDALDKSYLETYANPSLAKLAHFGTAISVVFIGLIFGVLFIDVSEIAIVIIICSLIFPALAVVDPFLKKKEK